MGRCCVCGFERTLTVEHIIPQALGGRLEEPLVCACCIRKDADQKLCDQLGPLAAMLDVKRDRRKGQQAPLKGTDHRTGIEYVIRSDGPVRAKPEFIDRVDECGELSVVGARSREDAEQHLARKRAKMEREGTADFSHATTEYSLGWEEASPSLAQCVGGRSAFRAVAKSAYCFLASVVGVSDTLMTDDLGAIRSFAYADAGPLLATWGFEHSRFFDGLWCGDWWPTHAIAIHFGAAGEGVVGYVQLFGAYRFAVLLAEHDPWLGEQPDVVHACDPLGGDHDEWPLACRLPGVALSELLWGNPPGGDDMERFDCLAARATGDVSRRHGGAGGMMSAMFLVPGPDGHR